jgi:2-C-methyl-D-erythritol 4-phosphate cytidylyltransferase
MAVSCAIIVAAGHSRRMGGIDKLFFEIAGRPVLAHSIGALQSSPMINKIVLVLSAENLQRGRELVRKYNYTKVTSVCIGGEQRQHSVSEALRYVGDCDFILVHDGARPCVTSESIEKGIHEAEREGIAIAASPITDTIKRVDDSGHVEDTLDRELLRSIHTPQVFRAEIFKRIHQNARTDATDDAVLAESMGYPVKVYADSAENIKITTPSDIAIAEKILMIRAKADSR